MCSPPTDSVPSADPVVEFAAGLFATVGVVMTSAWWILRVVVAPVVTALGVGAWRMHTGADLWRGGRKTGARFLNAAAPPVRPKLRVGVRVNWAYWPGWQRAFVRFVAEVLAVATWLYPLVTGLAVAATLVAVVGAAVTLRVRTARRGRPRKAAVITRQRAPLRAIVADATTATHTQTETRDHVNV